MYEIYLRQIYVDRHTEDKNLVDSDEGFVEFICNPKYNLEIGYGKWELLYSDVIPDIAYKLTEASLTMEDNSSGSLEIVVPPENNLYKNINTRCLTLEAMVKRDDEEIWRGRLLSTSEDFYKLRKCMFEGELSYLLDSMISEYSVISSSGGGKPKNKDSDRTLFVNTMNTLIDWHNDKVEEYKKFILDALPSNASLVYHAGYGTYVSIYGKSTLDAITELAVERNKLHMTVYHDKDGFRHLRFFDDSDLDLPSNKCSQEINFGVNLMDYAKDKQGFDNYTAIIPRGKELEIDKSMEKYGVKKYTMLNTTSKDHTKEEEEKDPKTLIDDDYLPYGGNEWDRENGILVVSDPNYLENQRYDPDMPIHIAGNGRPQLVVNLKGYYKYGFICGVVDWSDEESGVELRKKAKKYMMKMKYRDVSTVEVTAVDLHYLNPLIKTFHLLEKVHCYSEPHGLDVEFEVSKIDIDILNPENTKYTLGGEVKGISSATSQTGKNIKSIDVPHVDEPYIPLEEESPILTSSKERAAKLILDSLDGSYAGFLFSPNAKATAQTTVKSADGKTNITLQPMLSSIKDIDNPTKTDKDAFKTGADTYQSRAYGFVIRDASTDDKANNRWIWDVGGLMHQTKKKNNNGVYVWQNPNLAMTMDGEIVADRITTGKLTLAGATVKGGKGGVQSTAYLEVYSGTELIGSWDNTGIRIERGKIKLGGKKIEHNYDGPNVTQYTYAVTIGEDKNGNGYIECDNVNLTGKITAKTGKIGFLTINSDGTLGNLGNENSMSAIRLGMMNSTDSSGNRYDVADFGISVANRHDRNPNGKKSWGGIKYGKQSYQTLHFGHNTFALFDGNEVNSDGWRQGGFFVFGGSPTDSHDKYTKQTYNAFMIVTADGTVANYDENFYKTVKAKLGI